MDAINELSKGHVVSPNLAYRSPYDPTSPWSLVLVFLPETVDPHQYVRFLDESPLSLEGEELDEDIKKYIQSDCEALGWVQDGSVEPTARSVADHFLQCRTRQTDLAWGSISWDNGGKYVPSAWYSGVLRPLSLLRDRYDVKLSLKELETMKPQDALKKLLAPATPQNVNQVLSYIAEPYAEYTNATDFLEEWVETQPLEVLVRLTSTNLKDSVKKASYTAPLDVYMLQHLESRVGSESLSKDIQAASILKVKTLQDVDILRNSSPDKQLSTLMQFVATSSLKSSKLWDDVELLCQIACPNVDHEKLRLHILREALRRGEFDFISKNSGHWPRILVTNASREYLERSRTQLLTDKSTEVLDNILNACDLVGESQLRARYAAIYQLHTQYSLPLDIILHYALAVQPNPEKLLQKVLERRAREYQKGESVISLISDACGCPLSKDYANAQFVEAALADNNLSGAIKYCEALGPHSPHAWLAYFQASKYMSPFWDDGKVPPKTLQKKLELATKCIQLCPSDDLPTVLTIYDQIESLAEQEVVHSTAPVSPRQPIRKGAENLFVRGLGWAIGAHSRH